jgi:septal ring factor EnvC (AmiA/AmiB activator)
MRLIFSFLLLSLLAWASTGQKITTNQKSLTSAIAQEKELNEKLNEIANVISKERKSLADIDSQIATLQDQIKTLQEETKETSSALEELKAKNADLEKTKQELEKRMIRIIADQFSFYLVMEKDYIESTESIIADEVLREVDALIQKDFKDLSQTYTKTHAQIQAHNKEIAILNDKLKGLHTKQSSLSELQERQKRTVASLDKQSNLYKSRLRQIHDQKKELQATLENLKIIQRKEEEKRAEEAAQAAARAAMASTPPEATTGQKVTVRQIGSSYQDSKVMRYKGAKTIAPLDSFEVRQAFGDYTDPIYNIKIFNESVVLRSKTPQATVKNVLPGKIVYAKETSMLDHVVIVENSNGIHTIYAHMTQIAPTISVGKKIKKGYIIGRINQDLTFEVTQKNFHINPLELISIQ